MKILLTGPSGFIGSAFARLALSRGHRVIGLLIPSEPIPATVPAHKDLVWVRGTLGEAPWKELNGLAPEACVHTAWITTPGVYLESPENEGFRDASLEFVRRLCGLGVGYVFGLGTCIEYQITAEPLAEDRTPVVPTTTYARCKNELRLALEADAATRGFDFGWGRVFYPYGPGEHPSRLCSSILQKLALGQPIVLKTPQSTKDYIYIDDLASALLTVVERRFRGTINLGTGTGNAVRDIARRLGQLVGKPELVQEAAQLEPDPFPYVVADTTRLKSLGWRPAWTMDAGLERLAASKNPK